MGLLLAAGLAGGACSADGNEGRPSRSRLTADSTEVAADSTEKAADSTEVAAGSAGMTRGEGPGVQEPAVASRTESAGASFAPSGPGRWVHRPEDMLQFWLHDFDVLEGTLRVLYTTTPSLEQGRGESWSFNLYVVEVDPSGTATQHRLYTGQSEDYGALTTLALRRGRPEVFVPLSSLGADGGTLEVRAIPSGETVSVSELPSVPGPGGDRLSWGQIGGSTADGNLYFTNTHSGEVDGKAQGRSAWLKLSPNGEVLGRDQLSRTEVRLRNRAWFSLDNGGIGLLVDALAQGKQATSDLGRDPAERTVGGRTLRGNVTGALQILVTGPDASNSELLPPISTTLSWSGEMSIPQDLPSQEMMEQNREQMRVMREVGIEAGARRQLYRGASDRRAGDLVKHTGHGYMLLADGEAMDASGNIVEGVHLLEMTREGIRRTLPLEELANEMDVDFIDFVPKRNGEVFLLAQEERPTNRDVGAVLRLDGDGRRIGAAPVSMEGDESVQLAALVEGPDTFWVVGKGFHEASNRVLLWVQAVGFR